MAVVFRVLGDAGRDNALLVRVETGQAVHRLLFDCGEGVLSTVPLSEIQSLDHLFFSHLHMDHVSGFDTFFRATYDRTAKPNLIWGPPHTSEILHHRFQGYMWNLQHGQPGAWMIRDVYDDRIDSCRYELGDAFEATQPAGTLPRGNVLLDTPDYTVQALTMHHHTPSLAYILREKPRANINTALLAAMGLPPGPWLAQIKQVREGEEDAVEIAGRRYALADLRRALVEESAGASIAYLTDFLLDDASRERLLPALRGCDTLVCEAQYRETDRALALKHHHMTSAQVAGLARDATAGQLILFHVSSRYRPAEWLALLNEARAIFPNTAFPDHWALG